MVTSVAGAGTKQMRTKEEKETFILRIIILCDLEPCEYAIYFKRNNVFIVVLTVRNLVLVLHI